MTRRFQRSGRWGSGGWIAVAAIVALGSACLAGSPLYLSSVATAALQSELAHTCLADVGVRIPITGVQPDSSVQLAELAAPLAKHTQPGVLTRVATGAILDIGNGHLPVRTYLMYRQGQEANLGRAVQAPGVGEVLAPEWLGGPDGVHAGQSFTLSAKNTEGVVIWTHPVNVTDTYPQIPTRPEPAFWCGYRNFFRSQTGDPADLPPAVLLTTSDEVRTARVATITEWELRPDPNGMTRHDAAVLARQFDELIGKARGTVIFSENTRGVRPVIAGDPLRAVVGHAEAATAVVSGTMAPVRLVGLLAAFTLLVAATMLLAREKQRELRLRSLKGQSPVSLGGRVALGAAGAVIIGALLGSAFALAAVRFLGPASQLEPAAISAAIEYTLIGVVVSFVVIASAAAARTRLFVDAPLRRRSPIRFVPWELIPVGAVIVTFARLDRIGGIRQVGTKVVHADFLAQCFPLLAIVAPLAVLTRPTLSLLRRLRLAGKNLSPAVMTGLRRSLAEPTVTGAVLLATALAAGSFTLSRLLTDSTGVLLREKASTFLGSDLSIVSHDIIALPRPFDETGTVVARAQGHSGAQSVDLLGVDRATFERAVHWRDDASSYRLDQLLDGLAPGTGTGADTSHPLPALVVGGTLPDTHLENLIHAPIEIAPVASPRWFPGQRNGAVLVVVDRVALRSLLATGTEIWLRDPPADAVAQLSAKGVVARTPRDLSQVFDVTSFLTIRWAYATLSMLGALVGIVVLLTQLLVLDARRRNRQAAHVLTTRMGLSTRDEAVGLIAELAPALVAGAGLGVLIGWAVSRLAVPRLDSLRQLKPPARLVAEPSAALPLVCGVVGCLVLLLLIGLIMVKRTRVMEVMRGTA